MKAFMGRLMCCVVVLFLAAVPVASVYGVLECRDDCRRPSALQSDESESHDDRLESPDSDEP